MWNFWNSLILLFSEIAAALFSIDSSYETCNKQIFCFHMLFSTACCSGDTALPVKFHMHSHILYSCFCLSDFILFRRWWLWQVVPWSYHIYCRNSHIFHTDICVWKLFIIYKNTTFQNIMFHIKLWVGKSQLHKWESDQFV
jgi:hypothetical protein